MKIHNSILFLVEKNQAKIKQIISWKTWVKLIGGEESKSEASLTT